MFYGCDSLVGGSGTEYNSNMTTNEYAKVDQGTSRPGYFTAITSTMNYRVVSDGTLNHCETLADAVSKCTGTDNKITVLQDVSDTSAVTISNDITIDLLSNTVLRNNSITVDGTGTLTLVGNGNIETSSNYGVDCKGQLNVLGGTLKSTASSRSLLELLFSNEFIWNFEFRGHK